MVKTRLVKVCHYVRRKVRSRSRSRHRRTSRRRVSVSRRRRSRRRSRRKKYQRGKIHRGRRSRSRRRSSHKRSKKHRGSRRRSKARSTSGSNGSKGSTSGGKDKFVNFFVIDQNLDTVLQEIKEGKATKRTKKNLLKALIYLLILALLFCILLKATIGWNCLPFNQGMDLIREIRDTDYKNLGGKLLDKINTYISAVKITIVPRFHEVGEMIKKNAGLMRAALIVAGTSITSAAGVFGKEAQNYSKKLIDRLKKLFEKPEEVEKAVDSVLAPLPPPLLLPVSSDAQEFIPLPPPSPSSKGGYKGTRYPKVDTETYRSDPLGQGMNAPAPPTQSVMSTLTPRQEGMGAFGSV